MGLVQKSFAGCPGLRQIWEAFIYFVNILNLQIQEKRKYIYLELRNITF